MLRPDVWLDYFLNLSFNIKFLIMNKKFSTLMAGLMLASAFSVNAQTASGKYEDGKYYVLGSWDKSNGKPGKILSVESDRNAGASFGRLTLTNYSAKLEAVREAL